MSDKRETIRSGRNLVLATCLATILLMVACGAESTPTPTANQSPLDLGTQVQETSTDALPLNACTYNAPEPSTTPNRTTPTPTPRPTATPVGSTPTPTKPSAEILAYPETPPLTLPASVEAWKDAVVVVDVELARGHTRKQQGLVVSANAVLTVLDMREEIASLSVSVPTKGKIPAFIQRFDPLTGAALLSVDTVGLIAAPREHVSILPGEPVLLLKREEDGSLSVRETFASPSLNAPQDLFALLTFSTPNQQWGTVVVSADGAPVGLAGEKWGWFGLIRPSGPPPGPDQTSVLLGSALQLLEAAPPNANITPAAVAYHGQGWSRYVDGPTARQLVADPVKETINSFDQSVTLDNLDGRPGYLFDNMAGTMLELIYAEPQELRDADGTLLGSGRYIVLWWAREDGARDLVLCGKDSNRLGAAFATHDLDSFAALMEEVPSGPRSLADAVPLSLLGDGGGYQYPYAWELKSDQLRYSRSEPVTLTFTVTNISDWPAPLDYMPPILTIHSLEERRDVATFRYGNEHRVLEPGESASFVMTWDQMDVAGGIAPWGQYVARVHLINVADRPSQGSGPLAEFTLNSVPTPTPTPTPQPRPTTVRPDSPEKPPIGPGVEIGTVFPYTLYLHCAIYDAYFDGRIWMAQVVPEEWGGTFPPGWTRDDANGQMTLVEEDLAVFTSKTGITVEFVPWPSDVTYIPCF